MPRESRNHGVVVVVVVSLVVAHLSSRSVRKGMLEKESRSSLLFGEKWEGRDIPFSHHP